MGLISGSEATSVIIGLVLAPQFSLGEKCTRVHLLIYPGRTGGHPFDSAPPITFHPLHSTLPISQTCGPRDGAGKYTKSEFS